VPDHAAPVPWSLNARTLAIATLVILAVRLLVGSVTTLTEDEAYYRLWSLYPAFGYYDHPPMVAWWIAAGRSMVGDNPLGVRLLPILANAVSVWLVYDIARQLGAGERTAARAGLWFNATLLIGTGAMLALPDVPAGLFWLVAVWAALKARDDNPLVWWAIAGVAAGLATLSKYSAIFLAPGMVLWLVITPEGRDALRRPGPWIAAVLAVALFSLNIAWNAEHGWITFTKQFGRVAGSHFAPKHLAEFLVAQFLLLNPLIAVFAVQVFSPRRVRTAAADLLPLLALSAPFVLYLLLHSLHDRVQAHWPAPLYGGLAICAAAVAEIAEGRGWRWTRAAAPMFGFVLVGVALIHSAWPGGDIAFRGDPALALRRWHGLAERLELMRKAEGAEWVGTLSYGVLSQLAAEKVIRAPLTELAERDRYAFQPPALTPDIDRPGIVVDLERRAGGANLKGCFRDVRDLGVLDRGSAQGPAILYHAYRVEGALRREKGGCWLGEDLGR
jgi:4-amino-4-deoxy-L-arabinose transferase-like glycosyltransferase